MGFFDELMSIRTPKLHGMISYDPYFVYWDEGWAEKPRWKVEDSGFRLSLDLPGVARNDLTIKAKPSVVSLKWTRRGESHSLDLVLPKRSEWKELQADLRNGELTLFIPEKKEEEVEVAIK